MEKYPWKQTGKAKKGSINVIKAAEGNLAWWCTPGFPVLWEAETEELKSKLRSGLVT